MASHLLLTFLAPAQGPPRPFVALTVPVGDPSDVDVRVTAGGAGGSRHSMPWYQVGGRNGRVARVLCGDGRGAGKGWIDQLGLVCALEGWGGRAGCPPSRPCLAERA